MNLSDKIVKLRKTKGLSQEELANDLGVSRQAVFKWESGENTPDLEKIKKIALYFNVSFDTLLNDEIEITNKNDEIKKFVSALKKVNNTQHAYFRQPYDSLYRLDSVWQASYEHGYASWKIKSESHSFSDFVSKHEELIKNKNYTKRIRIQHDLLVEFFVDDNNKLFGFFFDGAPQFLCPYENLAGFQISNEGNSTGYTDVDVVGFGVGKNTSIGVGSLPMSTINPPTKYTCFISYFDKDGSLKDYKIVFECIRTYNAVNEEKIKITNDLQAWQNSLSRETNDKLNEVAMCLNGIKESGNLIKKGAIAVGPVDISSIKSEIIIGRKNKESIKEEYGAVFKESKKQTKQALIFIAIAFGVAIVLVAIILLIVMAVR